MVLKTKSCSLLTIPSRSSPSDAILSRLIGSYQVGQVALRVMPRHAGIRCCYGRCRYAEDGRKICVLDDCDFKSFKRRNSIRKNKKVSLWVAPQTTMAVFIFRCTFLAV